MESFGSYWDIVCDNGIASLFLHLLMIGAIGIAIFVAFRRFSPWLISLVSIVPFCCGSVGFWLAVCGILHDPGGAIAYRNEIVDRVEMVSPFFVFGVKASVVTATASLLVYILRRPQNVA